MVKLKNQKGISLVFAVFSTLTLLALAGFSIDIAQALIQQAKLQRAVDAAAINGSTVGDKLDPSNPSAAGTAKHAAFRTLRYALWVMGVPNEDHGGPLVPMDVEHVVPNLVLAPGQTLVFEVQAQMRVHTLFIGLLGIDALRNIYVYAESQAKRRPAVITLALDISGSMKEPKLSDLKIAARAFVSEFKEGYDQMSLVAFSDSAVVIRPMGPIPADGSLMTQIDALRLASNDGGGTNIAEALVLSKNQILDIIHPGDLNRDGSVNLRDLALIRGSRTKAAIVARNFGKTYSGTSPTEDVVTSIVLFTDGSPSVRTTPLQVPHMGPIKPNIDRDTLTYATCGMPGDVNGDKKVGITDVVAVRNLIGTVVPTTPPSPAPSTAPAPLPSGAPAPPPPTDPKLADIDHDGVVTTKDLDQIIRGSAGFPRLIFRSYTHPVYDFTKTITTGGVTTTTIVYRGEPSNSADWCPDADMNKVYWDTYTMWSPLPKNIGYQGAVYEQGAVSASCPTCTYDYIYSHAMANSLFDPQNNPGGVGANLSSLPADHTAYPAPRLPCSSDSWAIFNTSNKKFQYVDQRDCFDNNMSYLDSQGNLKGNWFNWGAAHLTDWQYKEYFHHVIIESDYIKEKYKIAIYTVGLGDVAPNDICKPDPATGLWPDRCAGGGGGGGGSITPPCRAGQPGCVSR